MLNGEICFWKKLSSECLSGQMWQKVGYIWKILGHLGASGDIELIEVFSILLRDAHENTYFKHPVNAPQKNMGWDKIETLASQKLCILGKSKLFSIYVLQYSVEFEYFFQLSVSQNSFQHLLNIQMSDTRCVYRSVRSAKHIWFPWINQKSENSKWQREWYLTTKSRSRNWQLKCFIWFSPFQCSYGWGY